jgi:membrane protease subunit (stomatin/prohibitin family)
MTEFKWHLMAEEAPEYGMREYLVMGPKGGLKLAHGYVMGHYGPLGSYFKTSVSGYDCIKAEKVHAWAEIPPFGSDDTCHIINDGNGWWECDECGCSIGWDDQDEPPACNFCPSCGRRVVQR